MTTSGISDSILYISAPSTGKAASSLLIYPDGCSYCAEEDDYSGFGLPYKVK
jgi:hypothetical protein